MQRIKRKPLSDKQRRVTENNLKFVSHMQRKFRGANPSSKAPSADIFQTGVLFLMYGILKHKPQRSKITTYGKPWIVRGFQEAERQEKLMRPHQNKMNQPIILRLDDEIKQDKIKRTNKPRRLYDILPAPDARDEKTAREAIEIIVQKAVARLKLDQRQVIEIRFGLNGRKNCEMKSEVQERIVSLKETAGVFKMSREWVRQKEKIALKKLKTLLMSALTTQ